METFPPLFINDLVLEFFGRPQTHPEMLLMSSSSGVVLAQAGTGGQLMHGGPRSCKRYPDNHQMSLQARSDRYGGPSSKRGERPLSRTLKEAINLPLRPTGCGGTKVRLLFYRLAHIHKL